MDKQRFFSLVSNLNKTSEEDTILLQRLVKEYPYFSTAHLFLLYNMKQMKADSFDQSLQKSALYVNDRKVLFNLINNISFFEVPQTFKPAESKESFDASVEFQLEETIPILAVAESDTILNDDDTTSEIEFGEPLQIDYSEENARVIEFDLSSDRKINASDSQDLIDNFLSSISSDEKTDSPANDDQASLIDKFISDNPVFTVNKLDLSDERPDISTNSVIEDEELVSETLARVYESQKIYDKAIAVYEKLILKFPEKSTYFASQIDNLRTKIN